VKDPKTDEKGWEVNRRRIRSGEGSAGEERRGKATTGAWRRGDDPTSLVTA